MGWRSIAVEPICWPCCCACLPVVGLLKGLLICIPCAIAPTVACFVIAIILLPHDIYYTFYTFTITPRLGLTVKFFTLILLPIPLLFWPFFVLFGTCIGAFGYALGGPVVDTFAEDESNVLTAGVAKTVKNCIIRAPVSFWDFNYNSYFSYLDDYRRPLHEGEKPFDVPLYWIPFGLLLTLLGELVALPTAIVLGIVKFFPGLCRAYYEVIRMWVKASCEIKVLAFPFLLLVLVVLPVAVVAVLLFFFCTGAFLGITPPGAAYKRGPLAGFKRIVNNIHTLDRFSNWMVFNESSSCMPCFNVDESFL